MKPCPGSDMKLDAPDGTVDLTCPNCGRRVKVEPTDWTPYPGAPRWRLRGHRPTTRV